MHKAVKWTMLTAILIAAAICVALFVFVSTFDLNDYKKRIASIVAEETGRTLVFDGDISLELFPRLGVRLGGVSLSNAKGFTPESMVRVDSAYVFVRLLPLLNGQVRFGAMELDGLTLNLSRNEHGATNWDDLVGRPEVDDPQDDIDGSSFPLEVAGVDVRNASLQWDDRVNDTKFTCTGLGLDTGRIQKGQPFPIKAQLDFSCTNPQLQGSLSFSGNSALDFSKRIYSHTDMTIAIKAEGSYVPGGKATLAAGFKALMLDFDVERAQVTDLVANSYGATVHFDGILDGLTSGFKKASGSLEFEPVNVRKFLAEVGITLPATTDPAALTKVAGRADVEVSPTLVKFSSVDALMDGTKVAGEGSVRSWRATPVHLFDFTLGDLDADRYFPLIDEEQGMAVDVAQGMTVIPEEYLKKLDLTASIHVSSFKIIGARFSNVAAKVKARHGKVSLSPLSAQAYGGKVSAGFNVDVTGDVPKTDGIIGVDKLNVGQLSKDMLGDASYAGIAQCNLAFSSQGSSIKHILKTMDGKLSFNLADGVFPGVDIIKMAEKTHAERGKKSGNVESAKTDKTKFGSISGTGIVREGLLTNKDLIVKAPGLRASGSGTLYLPTRYIDYLLKAKLVPSHKGQGGNAPDDSIGIMVPIRVSGSLEHPRYWVSLTEYVKSLGGAVLDTVGGVFKGVKSILTGVGDALTPDKSVEKPAQ